MRATSVFSLLFLILGYLLLPAFATPMGVGGANKEAIVPPDIQTLSPGDPTTRTSAAAPSPTPVNNTTSGDDSESDPQPSPASKGSTLSSTNAGVALDSRETLLFTVLAGTIATTLMF